VSIYTFLRKAFCLLFWWTTFFLFLLLFRHFVTSANSSLSGAPNPSRSIRLSRMCGVHLLHFPSLLTSNGIAGRKALMKTAPVKS
jgi:hypothetical protein